MANTKLPIGYSFNLIVIVQIVNGRPPDNTAESASGGNIILTWNAAADFQPAAEEEKLPAVFRIPLLLY